MRLLRLALAAWFATLAVTPSAFADYATDCASPTRTLSGGSSSAYSVGAGEVVELTGGAYTGGVNEFPSGATICVAADATFAPPYVNNAAGTLDVLGTATLPAMAVNAGFVLGNEGSTTFSGSFNTNGTAALTNAAGAELTATTAFVLSGGATLDNAGTFTAPGFTINSGSTVTNTGTLTTGQLMANGPVHNTGQITVNGSYTSNSGGSLDNACLIDVQAGWTNNASAVNSGLITITSGTMLNQGTLRQASTGQIQGADFTNNQTVSGFGRYRFTGNTLTQGTFSGDSATAPIAFWDTTSGGGVFDSSSGTVSNVVRTEVETSTATPAGCESSSPTVADLRVTKTGPATVEPGGTITYSVTVENLGPGIAMAVTVTDTLPGNLSDVSASDAGTVADGKVTWMVGDLAAGANRTLTVAGTAPASGTLENAVSVTAETDDPDPSNNSAQIATTVDEPPPPVDRPPVAEDQTVTINVNTTAVGAVPVSDPDEGQTVHVSLTGEPANGTAVVARGGQFGYRPDADYTGRDSFTVLACDNGEPVLCDPATVSVTVRPVAGGDSATTEEDVPVTIDVKLNDSGTTTSPQVVEEPSNGTVTAGPDGSLVYTPDQGYTGTDGFRYRICAPTALDVCAEALATVTVVPASQPPVIGNDEFTETTGTSHQGHVVASDPVRLGSPPRHGTVVVQPNGDYTYTPNPGYAGNDTFTLIACDDGEPQLCTTGRVIAHIAPIANDDQATTPENTAVSIDLGANDEGTVDPATNTARPEHGSVSSRSTTAARRPLAAGTVRYTPDAGFTGVDEFTYRICATGAPTLCDTAVVTITVTGGDTPPPGPTPTSTPTPTPTPNTPEPAPSPEPSQSSPTGPSADGESGLPETGPAGLGTIVLASLGITALGIGCIVAARYFTAPSDKP